MISEVFITCVLEGGRNAVECSLHASLTPKQIAQSAIEARRAGATLARIQLLDPKTRCSTRDQASYRAAVQRIREADVNSVINLTAGLGGTSCRAKRALRCRPTDIASDREWSLQVEELRPEIWARNCGSMSWALADQRPGRHGRWPRA
ncbi:3-keto-5-aminohexanoate cleavage protein [Bradyrhizobium cosmicum]|uniref:3-keto-5-aminohexanoate cleavage protein n=1 Tax=Bradyrhizobium cosmicum TaxID=1404864 RepID=UPI0039656453